MYPERFLQAKGKALPQASAALQLGVEHLAYEAKIEFSDVGEFAAHVVSDIRSI